MKIIDWIWTGFGLLALLIGRWVQNIHVRKVLTLNRKFQLIPLQNNKHYFYEYSSTDVTAGEILFKGEDLLEMEPNERAAKGVFLAFQYPVEIPGVNNAYLLKAGLNEVRKHRGEPELDAMDFMTLVRKQLQVLKMDADLLNRPVNDGFSGGGDFLRCPLND
mgnify:CR=1 FL=1